MSWDYAPEHDGWWRIETDSDPDGHGRLVAKAISKSDAKSIVRDHNRNAALWASHVELVKRAAIVIQDYDGDGVVPHHDIVFLQAAVIDAEKLEVTP